MDVPIIDITQLHQYTGELEPQEEQRLIAQLQATLDERAGLIMDYGKNQDWSQVATIVHNVKTNSLYIGAQRLHHHCVTGESLFRDSAVSPQDAQQWLTEFERVHLELMAALTQRLKEYRHEKKTRR